MGEVFPYSEGVLLYPPAGVSCFQVPTRDMGNSGAKQTSETGHMPSEEGNALERRNEFITEWLKGEQVAEFKSDIRHLTEDGL